MNIHESNDSLVGGLRTKSDSRRTPALIFSIIFFIAILILSLGRDSQILLVLTMYLCILLEGISVSALVYYSRSSEYQPSVQFDESKNPPGSPKGKDVVSSMDTYVSYAVRGSVHSRREIAFILKNILSGTAGKNELSTESDQTLQSDLNRVVYRYLDDSINKSSNTRQSRMEREAYLRSLERVISKIRTEML
jgi:hypothetical protein